MICFQAFRNLSVALLACLSLSACFGSDCDDLVVKEVPSPDSVSKAVLIVRSCGPTQPFMRLVALYDGSGSGNATRDSNVVLIAKGDSDIRLNWETTNRLIVGMHQTPPDITKQIKKWHDIEISYER